MFCVAVLQTRFQQLFDTRSKYTEEEIRPYVEGLCGKSTQYRSTAEVLLAHATLIDGFYFLKKT
jgi:hypothetical protein